METAVTTRSDLSLASLPRGAKLYVSAVIATGVAMFVAFAPTRIDRPVLLGALIIVACLTSIWKVNLPISLASGSTLSVSYAANLTSLLLLGMPHALVVAVAGVWTQCTIKVKQQYPLYRTVFSTSAEAITMVATGLVYTWVGGTRGQFDLSNLPKPLVAAIATYFLVNTGLVAGAIALSTRKSFERVWREDFLWSAASFVVAGTAGAVAAVVIDRGDYWQALLLFAPVYLTYRTYQLFVGRLDDQRKHVAEMQSALTSMQRLEQMRRDLFQREQAARASAEQANRLKDQFLAVVSHELRTPLNAILGWADMLRNGTLDESRRGRAVHAIYDSARRQAELIEELLDIARIMGGRLKLERSMLDLRDIVGAAIEVVQPAAEAKRIEIAIDNPEMSVPFYGDSARLQQIVWNLLTNAVKFTPEGGQVGVALRRGNEGIRVVVTDSGPGIPEDFIASVFEPFRQADASSTRRHGGLGLGMAIAKHLVEAHGGRIEAENNGSACGTTFTVRLPAAGAPARERQERRDAVRAGGDPVNASLGGISVLVVDDDEQSRDVVATYLSMHGATVHTADSAARAFELLNSEHADVLLADIAMPEEDGYSLIRRIRATGQPHFAYIPAAALTAFARDEDRQHAMDAGFQMHLPKPVDLRSLVDAVAVLGGMNAPQPS
jgi:signal transduction histidine kinase/CheY-like chemotaxis protein